MSGASPRGAATEKEAAAWVRDMFGRVAPRYDLLNHLLSFNIDRHWRSRTVQRLQPVLDRKDATVVDLCCGTGDLMLALRASARARVIGSDFCHPMLTAAKRKAGLGSPFFEADALQLPLANASVDAITVAFGFRNLANYEAGLIELKRVLKPGGIAAILEFSQPPNPAFNALYSFYSRHLLPRIGGLISGAADAYTYLPDSVRRFPDADGLASKMEEAGFTEVRYERMTFGIVALHTATRYQRVSSENS
jgi:demethylmenaquinone methyltransferase / 2-methoxy-6-polyprenyl-1,4-benzoquinol methylase